MTYLPCSDPPGQFGGWNETERVVHWVHTFGARLVDKAEYQSDDRDHHPPQGRQNAILDPPQQVGDRHL